jgi:hypothetical protein
MNTLLMAVGLAGTLTAMVLRTLAVDQVRGVLQRQISAHLEASIAPLPAELQAEWADEWRAELAATISMPITAARFARGLRNSARHLVGDAALAPAAIARPRPRQRMLSASRRTAEAWLCRVVQLRLPGRPKPGDSKARRVLEWTDVSLYVFALMFAAVVLVLGVVFYGPAIVGEL